MPWYKIQMSDDEVASGKNIGLQNAFQALWIAMRGPKEAAMFANRNIEDDHTFFFSPACSSFFSQDLTSFGATECPAPTRESVILLVGLQAAPNELLRSATQGNDS